MVKEIQARLLNHFRFGAGEEGAKEKVKAFAKDMEFFGISVRENAKAFYEDTATTQILIMMFDMGHTTSIRESCETIIEKHNMYKEENPVDKLQFQGQYVMFLQEKCSSKDKAVEMLKRLGSNMKEFGCPIGDNLTGYVMESARLSRLQALSSLGVMDKIIESRDIIKQYQ